MADEEKVITDQAEDKNPPATEDKDNPAGTVDNTSEDKQEEKKEESTEEQEKQEDKKEEEEEEEKQEPEKDSEEVAGLKADLAKLQGQLEDALAQVAKGDSSAELAQVNALLTVQKNLVSEYEGIITGLIEAKMAEVPENLKELVPANLSLKERMDWLTKAEKSGIFKANNPDIEIGKPMNPNTVKQQADTAKLSASAIMAMAYGNSKSKK